MSQTGRGGIDLRSPTCSLKFGQEVQTTPVRRRISCCLCRNNSWNSNCRFLPQPASGMDPFCNQPSRIPFNDSMTALHAEILCLSTICELSTWTLVQQGQRLSRIARY